MNRGETVTHFAVLAFSCLAILHIASIARAIEVSVIGPDEVTVNPGEFFSIDIALDNASATSNLGVTVELSGLAAAGATVTSGQSAASQFVHSCSATTCLGGASTIDNAFFNPADLSAGLRYTPGDDAVWVIAALSFGSVANTGSLDPGLDGPLDIPSARDATVHLIASTLGRHVLTFGGEFGVLGMGPVPITNTATFTVHVGSPANPIP
jgi:hypothetical protein